MKERFIVFDVETPNSKNDRISAIGITIVEDGKILGGYYHLIDPETHFDDFNIYLTGISPDMVKGKPNFKEFWRLAEPVMSSGTLIAHNAPFDMGVLAKCLRDYGIEWKATVPYACTVRISKKALPQLSNHKLNTLSDYLGLDLDHHNAASDSNAAACVLLHCQSIGADVKSFIKNYDLKNICTLKK